MKKYTLFSLAVVILFTACNNANSETQQTTPTPNSTTAAAASTNNQAIKTTTLDPNDPNLSKSIYRSDGFRPGIASEWIQVAFSENGKKVLAIWHWDTNNETPKELKVVSQENIDLEEFGGANTGKLIYGADTDTASFSIIENYFNLSISEGNSQEFEQEQE